MKIYEAWTDSMHDIRYAIGYFIDRDNAEKSLPTGRGGADPAAGITDIDLIDAADRVLVDRCAAKNIVQTIDAFTGFVLNECALNEMGQDYVKTIQRAGANLAALLKEGE